MPERYNLTREVSCLSPDAIKIYIDEFDDLTLENDGQTHQQLTVHRAFPLNAPDRFVVLKNQEGEEIGIVEDLNALDANSRQAMDIALEQTYFMPCITRVNSIVSNFHIPTWDVETNHGPRVFELPSTRRDLRVLEGGRILMRDADGNLYEIPDFRKLPPESRTLVEALI